MKVIVVRIVTDVNGALPTIGGVATIEALTVLGHPGQGRGTGGGTDLSLPQLFPMRSIA